MIKSQNIAILGFGKEGISSANFLFGNNNISIVDDRAKDTFVKSDFDKIKTKNIQFYFSGKVPKNLKFDLVVRSPGVRLNHPFITSQTKKGGVLTSATKIFFDEFKGQIIGVTGTKGKGTTATLIYELLKTKFSNVFLAGNIGVCPLDILDKVNNKSIAILELSSFQLVDLHKSPHIAVILMITSEHLDWHRDQNEYIKSKESIVKFQSLKDYCVINADYSASLKFSEKTHAKVYYYSTEKFEVSSYLKNNQIVSSINGYEEIMPTSEVGLIGEHNLQNILAAVSVARIYNLDLSNIRSVLKGFKGLEHRLQFVRAISHVKFYNDSFSTVPETTIAAINAFKNPKILILGGSSKNSDFGQLGEKIIQDPTVKALILIGSEAPRIEKAINVAGKFKGITKKGLKNMRDVVNMAYRLAQKGDLILLSPACASFDMFKNYQDRGQKFVREVQKLKRKG